MYKSYSGIIIIMYRRLGLTVTGWNLYYYSLQNLSGVDTFEGQTCSLKTVKVVGNLSVKTAH